MRKFLAFVFVWPAVAVMALTPVQFPIRDLTGADLARQIVITPLDGQIEYGGDNYAPTEVVLQPVPKGATNLLGQAVNGAWTNLVGGNYRITYRGITAAAQLYVPFGFSNGIVASDPMWIRKGMVQFFAISNLTAAYLRGLNTNNFDGATVGTLQSAAGSAAMNRNTWWVSAAYGNDATGLKADPVFPCSTIGGAMGKAGSGDMVSVLDGSFSESVVVRSNVAINLALGVLWTAPSGQPAIIATNALTITGMGYLTTLAPATTNLIIGWNDANISAQYVSQYGPNDNVHWPSFFFPAATNQTISLSCIYLVSSLDTWGPAASNVTYNIYGSWQYEYATQSAAMVGDVVNFYGDNLRYPGSYQTNLVVNMFGGRLSRNAPPDPVGTYFGFAWHFYGTRVYAQPPAVGPLVNISGDVVVLP